MASLQCYSHGWPSCKNSSDELLDTDVTSTQAGLGAVCDAAGAVCRLGWKFSWGVRVRMAELLLPHAATSFGQAPLLGLREQLAEHLWPALGVTAEIQDALQPFIFFQQFWRSGTSQQISYGLCCLK